jgi:hypothetical protein
VSSNENPRSIGPSVLIALGVLRAMFPVQQCLIGQVSYGIVWIPLQHCPRPDAFPSPLVGITAVQALILIGVGAGWWFANRRSKV